MAQLKDLIVTGASRFLNPINGNITGTSSNVTGTVAVANGGTGATTAANARTNLAVPNMISDSYPSLLPSNGSNNWIKIGTNNSSYGLLPSVAGNAGSGHNYLGTSTWYWKYAYIDEIYGTLKGNADTATTARQLISSTIRPTSADTAYYDGGLRHFLASSSMTTNKPMADGGIIDMQWDTSVGFNKQLFVGHQGTTKTRMQVRSQNQGTWGSWLPIGVFTQTAPTSGQLVVTDGTDGGIKASGTITGNLVIGNNSEFPKSYIDITQTSPNPNVYICYQGSSSELYGTRVSKTGVTVNHNSSQLELRSDDIVFSSSGNVSTWDGTNTSLKSALTDAKTKYKDTTITISSSAAAYNGYYYQDYNLSTLGINIDKILSLTVINATYNYPTFAQIVNNQGAIRIYCPVADIKGRTVTLRVAYLA